MNNIHYWGFVYMSNLIFQSRIYCVHNMLFFKINSLYICLLELLDKLQSPVIFIPNFSFSIIEQIKNIRH